VSQPPAKILLFIPMYNCERQIPRVIGQVTSEVAKFVSEVIVVNNRSTDGGQAAAIEAVGKLPGVSAKVFLNDANYGLGGSHKVAFNYAIANGFDYCIVLHGDDQGSITDLMPLLSAGEFRSADFLLGARFMKGAKLQGYSMIRTLGNHVFNILYSLVSGVRIYDLGSGLNLYSVRALSDRTYLRCPDDLTFNYQMILNAIAAKKRIRYRMSSSSANLSRF
jgi:dolichol-phosphate mannosyltransferase